MDRFSYDVEVPMFKPLPGVGFFFPWLLSMSLTGGLQTPISSLPPLVAPSPPPADRLREVYAWKQVDFSFPSPEIRQYAISSGSFVPKDNLPLGLEVWNSRIFVTLPRWKSGIPATLATIPRDRRDAGGNLSPTLEPYPNWSWHQPGNCDAMTSVFRIAVDPCGRLWVLDSGVVDTVDTVKQACPPQILVFDLTTDALVWRYRLPEDQVKEGSLFSNIAVDVRDGSCDDAHVYITDVWRFGLVVYKLRENRSWRITHHFFYPDPMAAQYELHGLSFSWTDGLFGLSLSPLDPKTGDRTLFFHPMSSFREFSVPTSVIRNETASDAHPDAFSPLGEPRYATKGQSSASAMDRRGVMFYNLVTRDSVGCWNSNQPGGYIPALQGVVAHSNVTLVFPNDLKIDHERRQSVWVLSNRLPVYLYSDLDPKEYNFRIMTAFVDEAAQGTVCDPNFMYVPSAEEHNIGSRLNCPF
uniref:Uncharacterized protein n=1 Tax=Timema monikensis TaxID=170555 RepID=A0A7R9HQP7_9NEOP|nr:unnamed protein product [Timema monikensis]